MSTQLLFDELPAGSQVALLALDRGTLSGLAATASQSTGIVTQGTWVIDPLNGNDNNDGLTPLTALRTDAERQRRWGPYPLLPNAEYHLRYFADVSEPILVQGALQNIDGRIFMHGSATNGAGKAVLATLAIDTLTALNRGTNTPLQFTSNGLASSWTADGLLNQRCRLTSGANVGGYLWPMLDLGAKTASMCEPTNPTVFTSPLTITQSTFAPAAGNTFVVESLTNIADLFLNVGYSRATAASSRPSVVLDSLFLNNVAAPDTSVAFVGCGYNASSSAPSVVTPMGARSLFLLGSRVVGQSAVFAEQIGLTQGYVDDSLSGTVLFRMTGPSSATIINFITVQRGGVRLGCPIYPSSIANGFTLQNFGVFNNSAGPGITVEGFVTLVQGVTFWGVCGVGGTPFHLRPGCMLISNNALPGAASYFTINVAAAPGGCWVSYLSGGAVKTTAPTFDPATSTFTTFRALTPAILQQTVAAGGLFGQWFDPVSGARMCAN